MSLFIPKQSLGTRRNFWGVAPVSKFPEIFSKKKGDARRHLLKLKIKIDWA
jgi:hypothetical protein